MSGRVSLKKVTDADVRKAYVALLDALDRCEMERGRVRGRAKTLVEVLTIRFGELPAEVSARILAADEATLIKWTPRVITEPTLQDVLGEGGKRSSTTRRAVARKPARRG